MKLKYPLGWDVAYNNCDRYWDGEKDVFVPPTWSDAITPYPDFVICKATQATSIKDFTFASNWKQLEERGTPRGAYHFFQAYKSSGAQAQYFVDAINEAGGIKPGDVLVMDWEEEGKMSLRSIIDFIYNVRRLTGIADNRTVLYSRKLLLGSLNFDKLSAEDKAYIKTIPLWIAGTFNNPDQVDEYDTIPPIFIPDQSKWGPVVLWQYGLDVNPAGLVEGFPGGLDFNWIDPAYYVEWKSLVGENPPPVEEGDDMFKVTTTSKVNIRKSGGPKLGTDIGDFVPGQVGLGNEVMGGPDKEYYCIKLTSINGAPATGWVYGRWNNAKTYATIEAASEPPPPDPDEIVLTHTIEVYSDGSIKVDGNPV